MAKKRKLTKDEETGVVSAEQEQSGPDEVRVSMMAVNLYDGNFSHSKLVAQALIPAPHPKQKMPRVIVHGQDVFVREEHGKYFKCAYVGTVAPVEVSEA